MARTTVAAFEAVEKSLTILLRRLDPSAQRRRRLLPDDALRAMGCSIVARTEAQTSSAFVLSESSLVISEHSDPVLMSLKTCGLSTPFRGMAALRACATAAGLAPIAVLYVRRPFADPERQLLPHSGGVFEREVAALAADWAACNGATSAACRPTVYTHVGPARWNACLIADSSADALHLRFANGLRGWTDAHFFGCRQALDMASSRAAQLELARALQLVPLASLVSTETSSASLISHVFNPHGLSLCVLSGEHWAALHASPELGYVSVQTTNPQAIAACAAALDPVSISAVSIGACPIAPPGGPWQARTQLFDGLMHVADSSIF